MLLWSLALVTVWLGERLYESHGRAGDIIVALEGKPLEGMSDLVAALEDAGVGKEVTLTVRRGEAQRKVKVAIIDLKD